MPSFMLVSNASQSGITLGPYAITFYCWTSPGRLLHRETRGRSIKTVSLNDLLRHNAMLSPPVGN